MQKIFVFDLDGTIIIDNKKLDSSILNKIEEVQKKGCGVYFATSRSIRGIKAVLPQQLWNNMLILCNGAFVCEKGKIVASSFIEEDVCKEIVEFLEENKVQFYLELGTSIYVPPYEKEHPFWNILQKETEGEQIFDKFSKISSQVYKIAILDTVAQDMHNYFKKFNTKIQYFGYSDGSADIVADNVCKWNALEKLFSEDKDYRVIAFGNDENDMEMIENADFGVAVCTNHKELAKRAKMLIHTYNPLEIVNAIEAGYTY